METPEVEMTGQERLLRF